MSLVLSTKWLALNCKLQCFVCSPFPKLNFFLVSALTKLFLSQKATSNIYYVTSTQNWSCKPKSSCLHFFILPLTFSVHTECKLYLRWIVSFLLELEWAFLVTITIKDVNSKASNITKAKPNKTFYEKKSNSDRECIFKRACLVAHAVLTYEISKRKLIC